MARVVQNTRWAQFGRQPAVLNIALLLLCAVSLAGCDSAGSAPPGITAPVFTVIVAVWKLRNMSADRLLREPGKGNFFQEKITEVGNHVKFFLRVRAEIHLQTQTNTDTVATAVAASTTSYVGSSQPISDSTQTRRRH